MLRGLRNCAAPAAAIVILAGLTAYLLHGHVAPHGSVIRHHGAQQNVKVLPASAAPAGTVLSRTPHGALALSDLRGHSATPLMSLPRQVFVSASLDNRYLATSNAQLLSLGPHGHLSAVGIRKVDAGTWQPVSPEPLADHDQYVALQDFGASGSPGDNPISVMSLATGKFQFLGTGDIISGDPAAAGVVVSLPAASVTTGAPTNGMWPDHTIVLRDVGRKDVVLGTAAQLNEDVHLPAGTLTNLFPSPDPAGDKIAIEVRPLTGSQSAGVVVVTRSGREVYAFGGPGLYAPAWSLSGQSLAMPAQGPHGTVLHIWNASGTTSVQPFPGQARYGDCVWSPDGASILCAVDGEHSNGQQWAVASVGGGPIVATKGPGYPISWLGDGR